jgi:hypothetical protein
MSFLETWNFTTMFFTDITVNIASVSAKDLYSCLQRRIIKKNLEYLRFRLDHAWYEGSFFDGRPNGYGVAVSASCDYEYRGSWKKGLVHGTGVFTFNDNIRKFTYKGEYRFGCRHGIGEQKETFATYKGNYVKNVPRGHGRLTRFCGCYIEGEFNGLRNIDGKIVFCNSTQINCTYVDGKCKTRLNSRFFAIEGTLDLFLFSSGVVTFTVNHQTIKLPYNDYHYRNDDIAITFACGRFKYKVKEGVFASPVTASLIFQQVTYFTFVNYDSCASMVM